MPGFDRTGPMGAGAMTGGARGLCRRPAGAAYPPAAGGYGFGRGLGRGARRGFGPARGRGFGAGRNWWGSAPPYPADDRMDRVEEAEMLRVEADAMRKSLAVLEKRLEALERLEPSE